jgi:ribosomal protein S24E
MAKNKRKFTATIYTVIYSTLNEKGEIISHAPEKFGTNNKTKIKKEICANFGIEKENVIIQRIDTETNTYIIPDVAAAIEAGFIIKESEMLQDTEE